jgi:2-desacetyl-2-hydroxyethyl bacteriochlorophyllide A dehydrogenase
MCKAIVFTDPGKIEIRNFNLPPCGKDEIIAKTLYSFVSPGTELRILSGQKESKGKFPLIPGYSWVGEIIEVGSNVKGWHEGELVSGRNPIPVPGINSLWGGQASHHRCQITGYDAALKLPHNANPWDYITTEVAAISWRGTSIAFPAKGETAVVVGQGMIGAIAAKWLMHHGARVIVTDLEESRLERARNWGAYAAVNGKNADAMEELSSHCPEGADIVIEASGSIPGVNLAISLLKKPFQRLMNIDYCPSALHTNAHNWPRIVFLATYTNSISSEPGALLKNEGAIIFTPMDRTVNDRLAVIECIKNGHLPANDILQEAMPVENAPDAYMNLKNNPGEISALAFQWT